MFIHYSSEPLNNAIFDLIQIYTLAIKYQNEPGWKRVCKVAPYSVPKNRFSSHNKTF